VLLANQGFDRVLFVIVQKSDFSSRLHNLKRLLHNLRRSLHNIRFFNASLLFRCIPRQNPLHKKRAAPGD